MQTELLRPELEDAGGHFYRSDFQVHTPRDTQYSGSHPTSDADRAAWATAFVADCRAKGLHAVAITDHHDFAFFPYVAAAAQAETDDDGESLDPRDRLVVFPGLELTLTVPCQAIMILDADFPQARLDDVLKALHFDPIDSTLATIPQTVALDDSGDIAEMHSKLDKNSWLRGRYIILPNLTPSGHKTLMRTSFQAKYNDMPCVGGYLDGDISILDKKANVGDKKILSGGDKAWGNKRVALFQTSDSRSDGFADLGKRSTWVKWSEPTAEAIRQACLAQESRIAQAEPASPNVWISRIVVSNSKFMGRVDVALNPQYSALIGGRGTGKSTLLDYLRWALCDQPASPAEDDEVTDPRVRQRRLIDQTLTPLDSHVEVHCSINGIAHVVRRYARDGAVHLKVGDGEFEVAREAVVQSLLPIQAYSQKQLSSVAIRLDELLRFVTSPILRELEDIDRKVADFSGRLRENYGTLQRHRVLSADIAQSEVRIASLAVQAQSLRDGLAGISDDDRKVLDEKAGHDDLRDWVGAWDQQLDVGTHALRGAIAAVDSAVNQVGEPAAATEDLAAEVAAFGAASTGAAGDLRAGLETARARFEKTRRSGAVETARAAVLAKLDAFDERYAGVKQRSSAHEIKLEELAGLERQQNEARSLLQAQQGQMTALGEPVGRHKELRSELAVLNSQRSAALGAQCDVLSSSSDGLIRAGLEIGRGFADAQQKFKALIAGSNVRNTKVEAVFDALASELDPVASWELVLDELESLINLEPDSKISSQKTPTLSRLGMSTADQQRFAPKLTPDGWLDLSLTPLIDHPKFEYRSKEGEYIAFKSASVGQQATALLTTLLSQAGYPLVIDQPEDDLDSETVQQIVSKIWKSKAGRQIVFSSHNANLVVNGDADLVLVCGYATAGDQSAGRIKAKGAIDVEEIRKQITTVMEGGERAFRLRKEKYGF